MIVLVVEMYLGGAVELIENGVGGLDEAGEEFLNLVGGLE